MIVVEPNQTIIKISISELMYYNTTNLLAEDLKQHTRRAETQTERILKFFLSHPGVLFTPIDVFRYLGYENMLITSIRRSISVLTKRGDLVKTDDQKKEVFGAVNYKWKLNTEVHRPKQINMFEQ